MHFQEVSSQKGTTPGDPHSSVGEYEECGCSELPSVKTYEEIFRNTEYSQSVVNSLRTFCFLFSILIFVNFSFLYRYSVFRLSFFRSSIFDFVLSNLGFCTGSVFGLVTVSLWCLFAITYIF